MQRIKRFPINGITENDRFDEKVMALYSTVTDEFLNRIYEFK
jgi:chromosome partitioning protein